MPEQVPAPDDGAKGVLQAEIALLRAQVAALKSQHEKDTCTIAALRSTLEAQGRCSPCAVTPPALEGSAYRLVNAHVPTEFGAFDVCLFGGDIDAGTGSTRYDRDGEIALIYGGIERLHSEGAATGPGALVRVHSSCFTGDVLSSLRCDCGEQLQASMQMVAKNGSGVVVYLHQEGRGIGLLEKLKAYNLQDKGLDTVDANVALGHPPDARNYGMAVSMLRELGISKVRLITNNPAKVDELVTAGLQVTERVAIIPERVTKFNFEYLRTKAARMDHFLGTRFAGDLVGQAIAAGATNESPPLDIDSRLPQDRPAVLYSNKPPFPVVVVNDLWLQTCGFQRDEVIGQTMSIIQGPLTETQEVSRLLHTIYLASHSNNIGGDGDDPVFKCCPPSAKTWVDAKGGVGKKPVSATFINYTKDRTAFKNEVEVLPGPTGSEFLLTVSTMTVLCASDCAHPLDPAVDAGSQEDAFQAVEACVRHISKGGMVLVADDEGRENEGDLIVASELIIEEQVAFMVRHCTGIVCCAMSEDICDSLKLPLMVENNEEYMGTKFCVTADAGPASGVTTGVSAWDRATTIRALADPSTVPSDLVRPGHIFPLRYTEGGVLQRGGHTEASVDLCKLAGLRPAACICELVKPGDAVGGMARRGDMVRFAKQHDLPSCSIAQIQRYIKQYGLHKANRVIT